MNLYPEPINWMSITGELLEVEVLSWLMPQMACKIDSTELVDTGMV